MTRKRSMKEDQHEDLCQDRSIVRCELHELTDSYEESKCNVIKDICVDEGARAVAKISTESQTGDDDPVGTFCSTKPAYSQNHRVIEEADGDFVEDVTTFLGSKDYTTKRVLINEVTEVQQFDHSFLQTYVQNSSCAYLSAQKPSIESPEKASALLAILDLSVASKDQCTDGETSCSTTGSFPGLVSYSGLLPYSGSVSLRSESSTTSTRSFAFPVLQSEWNDSPIRMAKVQKKRGCWHSLLCCRF